MSVESPGPASLTARRSSTSHNFQTKLSQMALQLSPLVQVTTGAIHPRFPRLFVNYWLLTEPELDALAAFYHQRGTGPDDDYDDGNDASFWKNEYPVPVRWEDNASLETKRRRFGRFIGLRGCESPVLNMEDWTRVDIPDDDSLNKMRWYG